MKLFKLPTLDEAYNQFNEIPRSRRLRKRLVRAALADWTNQTLDDRALLTILREVRDVDNKLDF